MKRNSLAIKKPKGKNGALHGAMKRDKKVKMLKKGPKAMKSNPKSVEAGKDLRTQRLKENVAPDCAEVKITTRSKGALNKTCGKRETRSTNNGGEAYHVANMEKKVQKTKEDAGASNVRKTMQSIKSHSEKTLRLVSRKTRALKEKTQEVEEDGKDNSESELSKGTGGISLLALQRQKILKRRRADMEERNEESDESYPKDLSKEHILQCINAIFHLTQEQLEKKNELFFEESHPIFMQVTCIRVPRTPKRQMRILLPHSIISPHDEVALFVCDLQRGRRKDYEPTVDHYQELLDKHGCTRIKSIIPMIQVKTEFDQYELKRKLVSSYDHFLVDGKIAGHISHLLGKEFYRRRKLPTSVRMNSKDLKHEIDYALRKTSMAIHSHGDTHLVQVGHTGMDKEHILENILATCNDLSKHYPGGWENIRSVRIKSATSLAVPVYLTLKSKNLVEVPVVRPKRPKAYRNVEGELTTLSGDTKVTVTPEGDVIVERKKYSTQTEKNKSIEESNI